MAINQLPQLYCPFPAAINPAGADVQEQTIVWARQLRFSRRESSYRRMNRLQYAMLMARAYPNVPQDALQLIADWSTWLFLLDDKCDESGLGSEPARLALMHAQLMRVFDGVKPDECDDPFAHGLWDIYLRLAARADDEWLARFRASVEQYFQANVWEASNRSLGCLPDSATYRSFRPFTSAVYPCLLLIELAENLQLPAHTVGHPTFQRLSLLANNVISFSNDIVSCHKERAQGDVHNLVLIYEKELAIPFARAVERVAALHDADVREFIALSERLPPFTPAVQANLQQYVTGMRYWMRANWDWSADAIRYHSVPAPATPHLVLV